MRLVVRLLGVEVLAVELGAVQDDELAAEYGPPFGFSASAGGQAERAERWPDGEVTDGG